VNSAGEARVLPVFEFDAVKYWPQARAFARAVLNGKPAILKYEASVRKQDASRRRSRTGRPGAEIFARNGIWEEYPVASSQEGGLGGGSGALAQGSELQSRLAAKWFFAKNGLKTATSSCTDLNRWVLMLWDSLEALCSEVERLGRPVCSLRIPGPDPGAATSAALSRPSRRLPASSVTSSASILVGGYRTYTAPYSHATHACR